MPVVPFSPKTDDAPAQRDPPPEGFALMAAAQMHKEGRLVQPQTAGNYSPIPGFRKSPNIEDRRKDPDMTPEEQFAAAANQTDNPTEVKGTTNLAKKLGGTELDKALLKKFGERNAN